MKKRIGAILVLLAALLAAVSLAACSYGAGPDTGQDAADDTNGFDDFAADLFVASYSYGFWDQITSGLEADFAMGDWNTTVTMEDVGTWLKVTVGSAAVTAGWSGGTLAQVPDTAASGSYFDFSTVAKVTFKVRGTLTPANVKYILQGPSTNLIETAITSYGVTSMNATDWSSGTIDVSSFQAQKIKGAFSFTCGTTAGYVEFKDIAFLDADGNNVDIASTVTYN